MGTVAREEMALGCGPWLLENPVLSYPWGSRTWIAEWLGRPTPSPEPQAEMWMGAHPKAPSHVRADGRPVPVPRLIADHPEAVLGREVAARFDGRLPFLFKVLAVERALSIQAHPDARQAAAGFEREERAGIPRSSPRRCYPDPGHKPELVCALTRFHALRGFRPPDEIAGGLERLGLSELWPGAGGDAEAVLRAFLEGLLGLAPEAAHGHLERGIARARLLSAEEPALAWIPRLHEQCPGDIGALAPLFLTLVELAPGDAMFLPARELHCYLEGAAVELMANSDNVLRGGLTEKHVDPRELLATLRYEPARFEVLRPEPHGGCQRYPAPAREFCLARIELEAGRAFESASERSVEILLCVRGEARIETAAGDTVRLERGSSALLSAVAGSYRAEGKALLYRAGVPA